MWVEWESVYDEDSVCQEVSGLVSIDHMERCVCSMLGSEWGMVA